MLNTRVRHKLFFLMAGLWLGVMNLGLSSAYAYTAITTAQPDALAALSQSPVKTPDPYEGFNRAMFRFNEALDRAFLKPIAVFYVKIVPKPLTQGIHNAFSNINTIPTIVNDALQLNFYQTTNDLWRLGINSTIGVVGLFDVATRINLPPYVNDFGLTMAKWGYRDSNYLVLPFFGPNTVRDGIEIPVDYYAFSIYPRIYPASTRYMLWSLSVVDRRVQYLKYEAVLSEAALDKYAFIRDAYMQHRAYQIQQIGHRGYGDQVSTAPLSN